MHPQSPRRWPAVAAALSLLALAYACTPAYETRPGGARRAGGIPPLSTARAANNATPRDRYEQGLIDAGRDTDQLEAWRDAGRRALRERLVIRPAFREEIRLAAASPQAVGYRLDLHRGQRLTVELARRDGGGRLFAELFEEVNPPSAMFRVVFAPHPDAQRFQFEATADASYVLRLQPELLEGGAWTVTVRSEAGLNFPVARGGLKSIGSWFGDPRDGGKRDHEGVDIFAPRGTAVVAAAAGRITAVRTTSVGGKVVWQTDEERGVSYYYAHLDRQSVEEGDLVMAGDPIGTVGTTGNARGTPPHLHFGVYLPGQVAANPVPYLYDERGDPIQPVLADIAALGSWGTITGSGVRLRAGPSTNAPILAELDRRTQVLLVGGVRDWHRVALDDGRTGFVAARLVGPGAADQ